MSELEKTAPNEIYLIVGDADKDCNFNELELLQVYLFIFGQFFKYFV